MKYIFSFLFVALVLSTNAQSLSNAPLYIPNTNADSVTFFTVINNTLRKVYGIDIIKTHIGSGGVVGGAGYIGLPTLTNSPAYQPNVTFLYRDSVGGFAFRYPSGFIKAFRVINTPTANRTYYLPDSSGTVALKDYSVQLSDTAAIVNPYLLKANAAVIYAPLISPAFTGIPIAPTPAVGTNTTQIQTTAGALAQAQQTTHDSLNSIATLTFQNGGTNFGDADTLLRAVNLTTILVKSLRPGPNVSLTNSDTTITINAAGGANLEKLGLAAMGSSLKAWTLGQSISQATTNSVLAGGTIRWVAMYLDVAATLTGIEVTQYTQGSYTANNENRVGLYSYSGGTLTLVASSTNNGATWQGGQNTNQKITFSSTYAASAGLYFVALIYNNSAQTTAPAITGYVNAPRSAQSFLDFTNSAFLCGQSAGTTLPSSIAASAITASNNIPFVAIY